MNRLYPAVAERADNRCEYCRAPELIFNDLLEVEHIVPVSQGGSDDTTNLALACRSCNKYKADFQAGTDPHTQTNARLFHPRQEDWSQHFRYDEETGEIQGRTPIGRATISRLQMNRVTQIAARRLWVQLDLFP